MTNWKPISSAPRDGTRFLARIGGAVYGAYYDELGRFIWVMHSNQAPGRSYQKINIDGVEYQREIHPEGEADYQPESKIWVRGFEDKPTHWAELPEPPKDEVNNTNEVEDGR